jgi:hypothetical protein
MAIPVNTLLPPKAPNLPIGPTAYDRRYQDQFNNALRIYFNQLDNTFQTLLSNDPGGSYIRFPFGSFQDTTTQTAPANTAQVMRFNTTDLSNGISLGSHTAVFTGTIDDGTPPGAGTVLTVTAVTSGTIYLGMTLTGGAITAGTKVVSQTSGTAGGVGAYVVSVSQERTSLTITGTIQSELVVATSGIYNLQWSGQFVNEAAAIHEVSVWLRQNGTDVVGSTGRVSINAKHGAFDGGAIVSWNYFVSLNAGEYVELWWSTPDIAAYLTSYVAGTSPTRPTTASIIATMTFVSALTA